MKTLCSIFSISAQAVGGCWSHANTYQIRQRKNKIKKPCKICRAFCRLIVVVAALNWSSISSFITDNFASDFKATTAIGFYLVIVGGVLTALAGLMPAKKS